MGVQQRANVSLLRNKVNLPLCDTNYLAVKKTEEKGFDVNLGAHLIMDAYEGKFDVAIVVSNDSNLAEPIRMVNSMTNLNVRLLNPYPRTQVMLAKAVNNNIKYIRKNVLRISQFFEIMTDVVGSFFRPPEWK